MLLLSVFPAELHSVVLELPSPCLPHAVMPTMSLCWSLLLACSTAWLADHFLPVLVSIPALRIEPSCDCLSVITSRVLSTLNSSTKDDSGSCSGLVRPYSPMLVKLGGTPSHRRRPASADRSLQTFHCRCSDFIEHQGPHQSGEETILEEPSLEFSW